MTTSRTHAHMLPDEQGCLAVTCWCERRTVRVHVDLIRAGITAPCGPDCQPTGEHRT